MIVEVDDIFLRLFDLSWSNVMEIRESLNHQLACCEHEAVERLLLQENFAKVHKLQDVLEISRPDVGEVNNRIFVMAAFAEEFVEKAAVGVEDESVTLNLDPIITDEGDVLGVLIVMEVPESVHHGGDKLAPGQAELICLAASHRHVF